MKKSLIVLLVAGALAIPFSSAVPAEAAMPVRVWVDNQRLQFDAQPENVNGRLMVPIRPIVESLGAQVTLHGDNTFSVKRGDTSVKIRWNSSTAFVDDMPTELPSPAYIKDGRTYVPLRFVGEAFASTVTYRSEMNSVVINTRPDPVKLRFPVISDIHVQATDLRSQGKFLSALRDLYEAGPNSDALVINGDLTNGHPADYNTLRLLVNGGPAPKNVLYTIGNHEFYQAWFDGQGRFNPNGFPNGETNQSAVERFLAFSGQSSVYRDEWINGYHFVMLGSEGNYQEGPEYADDAWLSQQQLNWLRDKLREDKLPGKPIFVFLHQPLPNTVSGSALTGVQRSVAQHQELKQILSEHPEVLLFSGHTHWQLNDPRMMVRDKFAMFNSSAVIQPESGDPARVLGPEASEGLYVEVYEDKVEIYGRDFYRKQWIPEARKTVTLSTAN